MKTLQLTLLSFFLMSIPLFGDPRILSTFSINDPTNHNRPYTFVFTCIKEPDNTVFVSWQEPSGGILNSSDFDCWLSAGRTEVALPVPKNERVYAFGKFRLEPDVANHVTYIYWDGGLTTGSNEFTVNNVAIGKVDGILH